MIALYWLGTIILVLILIFGALTGFSVTEGELADGVEYLRFGSERSLLSFTIVKLPPKK
jgi:hypothetical protein